MRINKYIFVNIPEYSVCARNTNTRLNQGQPTLNSSTVTSAEEMTHASTRFSRIKSILVAFLVVFMAQAGYGVGQLVTWDFENETGVALDGLEFGFSEVSSVRLDVSAIGGKFNVTGSGFGIDAPGSDDSDAFDGIIAPEGLQFSFSTPGTLKNLKFDRFTESAGDSFGLTLGSNPKALFTKSDLDSSNNLLLDYTFSAGEMFSLTWESGNGFGLETLSAEMSAVPEPEHYALIAAGGLMGFAWFRRRIKARTRNADHQPAFFS